MENGTVSKKINFSNFLSSQVVINPLKLSHFQQNRLKEMAAIATRDLVTIRPNFTSHNGWTNCHRRLDQLSQVTICPPSPRGGLNETGIKKIWDEKFKSPTVTRTKHVGGTAHGLNVKAPRKTPLEIIRFLLLMFLEV